MCKKTWVATNAYRPKPRPSQAEGQGGEQQERDSTMKSRKAPKKFGKKHKEPGTLPAGFAEAMSLTEALSRSTQPDDDGYYDDVHKLLAAQAAHTILSGFHVGKVPIKVCWLSLVSNEPIGMFYSGAKDAYRGILIRYEAGTKGRRYCSFTPPHDGGISGAGFGAVPFEEKELSTLSSKEVKVVEDLAEVLLRSTQPDIDIPIPELVGTLKGATEAANRSEAHRLVVEVETSCRLKK